MQANAVNCNMLQASACQYFGQSYFVRLVAKIGKASLTKLSLCNAGRYPLTSVKKVYCRDLFHFRNSINQVKHQLQLTGHQLVVQTATFWVRFACKLPVALVGSSDSCRSRPRLAQCVKLERWQVATSCWIRREAGEKEGEWVVPWEKQTSADKTRASCPNVLRLLWFASLFLAVFRHAIT